MSRQKCEHAIGGRSHQWKLRVVLLKGLFFFSLQVLDKEPECVLHHLRGLLLPGVPAQRGHVHRRDDADLRPQRQTQQPQPERRGLHSVICDRRPSGVSRGQTWKNKSFQVFSL